MLNRLLALSRGDENKKVIIYMDELGVSILMDDPHFIYPYAIVARDTMAATDAFFNGAFVSKIAAGGTMHESVLFASVFLCIYRTKRLTAMPVLSQVGLALNQGSKISTTNNLQ